MDEREFAEVVRLHRPELLGYARRIARTDAAAEDAVQQALLQAWVALQRDDLDVREIRPWLYRIVHNTTVSALRRPPLEPFKREASAASMPADAEFETRQQVRETFAGLAALPELQRNVMLSTAVDGRTHEQIAAAYGLTKGAVRGLIYRARASLRAAVAALTPTPVVAWAARHRLGLGLGPGPSAGEALAGAGAGSAGLAGVIKSGVVVIGVAASTGGVGYAVLGNHPASVTLQRAAVSPGGAQHRSSSTGSAHRVATPQQGGAPAAARDVPATGSAPAGLVGLAVGGDRLAAGRRGVEDRGRAGRDGGRFATGVGAVATAPGAGGRAEHSGSTPGGSGSDHAAGPSSGSGGRGPSSEGPGGGPSSGGSGTGSDGGSSSSGIGSGGGGSGGGPGPSGSGSGSGTDGGSSGSGGSGTSSGSTGSGTDGGSSGSGGSGTSSGSTGSGTSSGSTGSGTDGGFSGSGTISGSTSGSTNDGATTTSGSTSGSTNDGATPTSGSTSSGDGI